MTIDLKKFCSTSRPYIKEPWSDGDFTYATNGHILVRVSRLDGVEENKSAPDTITKIFADNFHGDGEPVPHIDVTFKNCSQCRGRGKVAECVDCDGAGAIECNECGHESECETCDGEGWVTLSGAVDPEMLTETCHICNGDGKIPDLLRGHETPVRLKNGRYIAVRCYLMILDLPAARFAPEANGPTDPIPFWFEGGEGLVMPLRHGEHGEINAYPDEDAA